MKTEFNGQDVTRTKLEEIPREGIHPRSSSHFYTYLIM
jgi:hypothetical protein